MNLACLAVANIGSEIFLFSTVGVEQPVDKAVEDVVSNWIYWVFIKLYNF